MKSKKQEQAKKLYFQSSMSKTEIATQLNVNRRTVMLWCHQGNWDSLRQSARHLPSLVVEKCYYLIDHFASSLLSDRASPISTMRPQDAEVINKLATSIKKLKNRVATNESMEMFNFFLDGLRKRDEKLAGDLLPHVEYYMECRKNIDVKDFLLEEFNEDGFLPFTEKDIKEKWQDEEDKNAFKKELQQSPNYETALKAWEKATVTEIRPPLNDNDNQFQDETN